VPEAPQPVFFYDLADPWCYLAGERIMAALPVAPEWEPIRASGPVIADGAPDRGLIERRADEQGLQPLRWPKPWPPDTELAMLVATYAKHVGRAVAFSLAAFRQAFAGGRSLAGEDTVLIAAAACEMHPAAVLKGVGLRSVREGLDAAGARAYANGVRAVPAITVDGLVLEGPDCVEEAAKALSNRAGA
jgi:2-hydroxychromene-2-carboxylate isomerase